MTRVSASPLVLPLAQLVLLALALVPADAASLSESTSLASLVTDVVARATSTSEVLTLNLTNLIILIVIKAIVIVFGMFAFGGGFGNLFGGGGFGRSADSAGSDSWLDRQDLLLMLTYLLSSDGKDYGCLNRVACEQPERATEYITAGRMLFSGAKMADGIVSVDDKYTDVLQGMQKAVYHARSGGACSLRYSCSGH